MIRNKVVFTLFRISRPAAAVFVFLPGFIKAVDISFSFWVSFLFEFSRHLLISEREWKTKPSGSQLLIRFSFQLRRRQQTRLSAAIVMARIDQIVVSSLHNISDSNKKAIEVN